ncbi:hypothetical protein STEPF1_05714 [Streptomyces sp. F-1]|nr:hypothetical protein STEPF1_05714 [Streptomyces sp. F-1]
MPNASPRRRAPRGPLRALPGPAVDNWPARGYLAVVAAALGFFLYAVYLTPDPGFAGIWPLMATAPLGLLLTAPAFADLPSWPGSAGLLRRCGVVRSGQRHAARPARPPAADTGDTLDRLRDAGAGRDCDDAAVPAESVARALRMREVCAR